MTEAHRRRPPAPIPLTVLTGFLGAGKTTLLNRLLRDPDLADTVVVVNEFGEIGLDHLLVETLDSDLVLLSAGCLCCTVRGDLIATLEDLLRRRDNGRIPPFRRVVVETTGLADPAPVLHVLVAHPYLALRYALAEVVTVVDAVNGPATLDAHAEAVKQAAVADRIVISKADLADAPAVANLEWRLRALNPGAAILAGTLGDVPACEIVGRGLFDLGTKSEAVRGWLGAEAVAAVEHGGHGHRHGPEGHHHDVDRHDARIRAFTLTSAGPVPRAALEMFLDLLRASHGPKLLRLKGLVATLDEPERPLVVHAVQHLLHPPVPLPAWPDGDRTSRLVLIVQDLDKTVVERLWDAFLGRPRVDGPDRTALAENPLAFPRGG